MSTYFYKKFVKLEDWKRALGQNRANCIDRLPGLLKRTIGILEGVPPQFSTGNGYNVDLEHAAFPADPFLSVKIARASAVENRMKTSLYLQFFDTMSGLDRA